MARQSRSPAGSPVPRSWSIRPTDLAAIVVGNGLLIAAMWVRHGGLGELDSAAGILTAAGQLDRPLRHVPRAHPAGPDVAQPVARPAVRDGPARVGPPLGRLRLRLAARRPRARSRRSATGSATGAASSARPGPSSTTYPFVLWAVVGFGPVRRGRGQLDAGRAATPVVRDLARASTCTPTWPWR